MGGLMSIGKSKAKVYMKREVKVTFDDVAGVILEIAGITPEQRTDR